MAGPIGASVDVSRNKMERSAKVARNFPLAARAIDLTSAASPRICDSASWDPVDASKEWIFLSLDAANSCFPSFDHVSGVIG